MIRQLRNITGMLLIASLLIVLISSQGLQLAVASDNDTDNITNPIPLLKPLQEGVNVPPMPDPDKGNPKLSTFLNQLILAEKRDEADSFARQRNVQLVDSKETVQKVRVEVDSSPGQLDVIANVAATTGTVELISRDFNGVQAVVPITSLTALAEEKSIKIIGIPVTPSH